MAKERIASNEKINSEIENIKEYLSSSDICFTEYSDVTVRRLVEYYNYNFSYHLWETTLKQQQKRENLKTCSLLKIIIKL